MAFLAGYLLGSGTYPATIEISTPTGSIRVHVKSWHDLRTIHEVFCAEDYHADSSTQIIVDYGSNIGISALYFLSRNKTSFIYLFEPVPTNVELLKANLAPFSDRYNLQQVAVGLTDGELQFGYEPTGRLGGIGRKTGNYITVRVKNSREILQEIINTHGHIDILKIDIETLERQITEDIPQEITAKIKTLYVEYEFDSNPLSATHRMECAGTVSHFVLKRFE